MFSCEAMCAPADPVKDTIRFDVAALAKDQPAEEAKVGEEERLREQEREAKRIQEEEEEQARLREEAERAEQQRCEQMEAQQRLEEERRRAEAEAEADERRAREEQAWREEEERLVREAEELARAEASRWAEAEAEAARAAAEERERKAKVEAYLKANNFAGGVSGQKKSFFKTTYPLHAAAKSGDAQMVELLLKEGADDAQKNSSGKTAAQVAQKSNRENSHAGVLRLLATSGGHSAAGGA